MSDLLHSNEQILQLKEKAIEFIKSEFDKYGHFPTYEIYPLKESKWVFEYPSPYIHANVLYALINGGYKKDDNLIRRAAHYLWKGREFGSLWRFWKVNDCPNAVFCGTEDTALASLVLEKLNYTLKNKHYFYSRIRDDGAIYTWFIANRDLFSTNPFTYIALKLKDLKIEKSVRKNRRDLTIKDIEPNITASIMSYLKESDETMKTIHYLITTWDEWSDKHEILEGKFNYYYSKLIYAFYLARAYKEGCSSLKVLQEKIRKYIILNKESFEYAESIIAFLTLKYLSVDTSLQDCLKQQVLSVSLNRDSFTQHYKFIASNDREWFGGSGVLTAAWFVEFLNYIK